MYIYFVRHGLTLEHENRKSQLPTSPLSKEGERQAKLLAKRLKKHGYKFDVVMASPFERARKTAEIICEEINAEYEEVGIIHEKLNAKVFYGKGPGDKLFDKYIAALKKNWTSMDWKYNKEGESIRELAVRAKKFKEHLLESHAGQKILVVSHGAFGRCFIANCVLGDEAEDTAFMKLFQAIKTENTGLSVLEYNEEEKVWKLGFLNDHSHLQ